MDVVFKQVVYYCVESSSLVDQVSDDMRVPRSVWHSAVVVLRALQRFDFCQKLATSWHRSWAY